MQSKTSFFNPTLFRKNLTRFWPLWAVPSFVGALFPLAYLTSYLQGANNSLTALDVTALYYDVAANAVPILSLCYAVLVALAVWSYLFNSRSTGMMHTLPLRREGLFTTGILSGMAMLLIPYVVTGGLCIVVFAFLGGFNPMGILVTALSIIGESFFYFASATLVAFITGNLLAMPVLYFIFHFLAVGLDVLVNTFAGGFLFGLYGNYSGTVEYLSPTVYLMNHVWCDRTYTETFVSDTLHGSVTPDGIGYYNSVLSDASLEGGQVIAIYALVGVVLLALAYALYHRRRSESAGDVVAVGWMKPVFRYGVAICGSMAGGLVLYAVFWGNFQSGSYYDMLPLIVFMIVAGAISYYAASMLLAKSLRIFRGSWKGLGLTALCAVVICGALRVDLFRIEKRVPAVEQLESMTIYVAGNNYTLDPAEDAELIEEIRAVHLAIAQDKAYILASDAMETASGDLVYSGSYVSDFSLYNYIRLNYTLKNGTTVTRRYHVPITRDRLEQSDTYDFLLDNLVNSQSAKSRRFHLNDGYVATGGSIYLETVEDGRHTTFGNKEAAEILNAVQVDMATGSCGNYDWFGTSSAREYALELDLDFEKPVQMEDGRTRTTYDTINVRVYPEMTNTVNALLKLKLATSANLKTRVELDPEAYSAEMQEWYDKYPQAYASTNEITTATSETPSLGIIGGADGPTTVFVTGVTR